MDSVLRALSLLVLKISSYQLKILIAWYIEEYVYELENIEERLEELEPKQRIELLIKLMPYVFPKLETISHTTNEPLQWEFE